MLWIVEPHADDAFLSLHGHLVGPWKGLVGGIVTVTGDDSRNGEAATYARAVGILHAHLNHRDSKWGQADPIKQVGYWGTRICLDDTLVLPLGLRNPDHRATSQIAYDGPVLYYLDSPYYMMEENAAELAYLAKGMIVESILPAPASKRHFMSLFPSQATRFLLNLDTFANRLEIVLRRP
jgi:hypothetical protein